MSTPPTILQNVKDAYTETKNEDNFIDVFTDKIELIIRDRSSTAHYIHQDITSDIAFLCRVASDNNFADRQLIKLVADYVKRSLEKDPLSRQDSAYGVTYMKAIRN